VGAELVMLDVTVTATLINGLADGSADSQETARLIISARLRDAIYSLTSVDAQTLKAATGLSDDFIVQSVSYSKVIYVDAGVEIVGASPAIVPSPDEILWINSVTLAGGAA
jgi:hypothetical protein